MPPACVSRVSGSVVYTFGWFMLWDFTSHKVFDCTRNKPKCLSVRNWKTLQIKCFKTLCCALLFDWMICVCDARVPIKHSAFKGFHNFIYIFFTNKLTLFNGINIISYLITFMTSKHFESAWKTRPNIYKNHLNRHKVQMNDCRLKHHKASLYRTMFSYSFSSNTRQRWQT